MASDGYTSNGRQYQGMTRNGSPVFLMYPPDPSGRRPSQLTQLQYATPAQREAHARSDAARFPETGRDYHTNQPTRSYGPSAYNQTAPMQTTGHPMTTAQRGEPTFITRAGDHTSSESSRRGSQRPQNQPTGTTFWYCCTPGCFNKGPYIEGLYENCYNGCGHRKCFGCRREIGSLQDRAPIDQPSTGQKRHW